ncbi:reverse transcriptase domain-containing protein, partial [Alcanivorax jadensis]|uniref:reverse transcriptase domain-containing protein n=1 Tax=Alcanivorax jadensis TaxID=64988 RepID=UPI0023572A23
MISSKTTPRALAHSLGTTLPKLNYTVYKLGVSRFYNEFEIEKSDGGKRTINAPEGRLKIIQDRLKVLLDELYSPHPSASAYIKERGIVYNAKKHVKRKVVANIDLKNFFGTIHFGRVRGVLIAKPYCLRADTATLIAHICCLDGVLPQGSPASPVISNMISRRMDRELSLMAKKNRAHYSRYADDITFSFKSKKDTELFDFKNRSVGSKIVRCIEENGFSLNERKTRIQFSSERQTVTGLKVNKKINIDRRYIRETKAMVHSLSFGSLEANKKFIDKYGRDDAQLEDVVFGRVAYIGMIKGRDSSVYQGLARKFNNLDWDRKLSINPGKILKDLEWSGFAFKAEGYRARFEQCVWVVSFDGVKGLGLDEMLVSGSAFSLKGGRVLTAFHVFVKAGMPDYCYLYRINKPGKKYKAKIKSVYEDRDVLELKFDEEVENIRYLDVAPNKFPGTGYELAVLGFPQLHPGHQSLTILPCKVVNTYIGSTFRYCEVDAQISGGNSGGPVVNAYMQVVGMALRGVDVASHEDRVELEGSNAFISAGSVQNSV